MSTTTSLESLAAQVVADGTQPRGLIDAIVSTLSGGGAPTLLDDGQVGEQVREALVRWHRRGVRVATPGTRAWPTRLDRLPAPPRFLAIRGAVPGDAPTVAIVGQRRATPHGREVTSWLADAAARAGVIVVSGGAVGIDAAAHRATVDAGGRTLVVLGCGHDVDYPRPHAMPDGLFDCVVANGGGLVAESLPGDQPRAHRVLARNRLVAAFADAVIVVEGGARSGTLNTATHAGDQGVPVLAVPGDIRAPGSAAPNQLLAEGCAPCRGPQDLLQAVGGAFQLRAEDAAPDLHGQTAVPSVLPEAVAAVLAASFPRPVSVDQLSATSGTPAGSLLAALTRARIAGEVAVDASGVRLRRAWQ